MKNILHYLGFCIILSFQPLFLFAQNEVEPNNDVTKATTVTLTNLAASSQGTINPVGDLDYFKLTVPRAGVITSIVSNVASNLIMDYRLYDANQNEIGRKDGWFGETVNFEKKVCNSGVYYIRLSSGNNGGIASTQLYTLAVGFDTTDIYECNDNFDSATPMKLNDRLRGAIRTVGDQDLFKFTIPRSGIITSTVSNVASDMVIDLTLYDENQNQIGRGDGWFGQTVNFGQTVCNSGTYYIRLYARNNDKSSNQLYNFTIGIDTTDKYECNNDFNTATAVKFQDTIRAAIRRIGDQDFYKFTVHRTGVVTSTVSNVPSSMVIDLRMYDDNQNEVGRGDGWFGQTINFEQLVCKAGTYYIKLFNRNNSDESPQLYLFTLGIDTTDKYECNNEYNVAKTIRTCDTIEGTIRSLGDIDIYKFNASSAGVVKVRLLEVPSSIDMQMGIANSAQTTVGNIIYANVGQGISADITLPSSGDYYFVLFDRNNNASSPNKYKIRLEKGCTTGTDDIYNLNFDISPNPASNQIAVRLGITEGPLHKIEVVDLIGKTLSQKEVNENQVNLDVSTLPNGLYLLKVETKEGKKGIQKFIKE